MCGICGKINIATGEPIDAALIKNMLGTIAHRGPDDEGMYISSGIALGHRRLSIIDLSTGKQPIANENRSIWVVFNGEIYNYRELTSSLKKKGHVFSTETDTEVLVHLYEECGEDMLAMLRGMFAFALWDDREKRLLIARDRVGIKPLYYYLSSNMLLFASEIKSILADPLVDRSINTKAIDSFLKYMFLPQEETLFARIFKLAPGSYLTCRNESVEVRQYWDLRFPENNIGLTFEQAKHDIVDLLRETVRYHMISDVPVGFLLSGGIDSTSLLSFAVEDRGLDISTFTIGFEGDGIIDERPYARLAASRYGTKHHEMSITANDFLEFFPKYVWHMEEPVCDPSAIALYYVSRLARQYVKVLLSGEGGDEAFAGYQTYRNIVWLERLKRLMGAIGKRSVNMVSKRMNGRGFERFEKYAFLLDIPFERYYFSRKTSPYSYFHQNRDTLYTDAYMHGLGSTQTDILPKNFKQQVGERDILSKMLYVDTKSYLPNDLLVKADKITMANSLELRVPLLDHKVLEFAAALPPGHKLHGFSGKYLLKKALAERVPKEILYRKKTGFPTPFAVWLRRDLNSYVQDMLLSKRSLQRGYFREEELKRLISANKDTGYYSDEVFSLMNLEMWHRIFID